MITIDRVDKLVRPEFRVVDERQGKVHAVVSTEAVDRMGDIIRQEFWNLADFNDHPVLLQSHNYGSVLSQIGEWENMRLNRPKKTLEGDAIYYKGRGNADADWAFELAKMGKAAYSVGFIPDMEKAKEIDGEGTYFRPNFEFRGQKLLEVSHVVIPANAEALQAVKVLAQKEPMILELVEEILAGQKAKPGSEQLAELSDELVERLGIPVLKHRLDLIEAAVARFHEIKTESEPQFLEEVFASWK